MKEHDFDKSLELGEKGERSLNERYEFNIHTDKQLRGIDGKEKEKTIEVKTRDFKYLEIWYNQGYMDILFETISKVETNKLGWIYTSEADILRYAMANREGNDIIFYYDYDMNCLRKFFTKNRSRYEEQETSTKQGWHTRFVLIPMSHIPNECKIQNKSKEG